MLLVAKCRAPHLFHQGFAVRSGVPFEIEVTFNAPLANTSVIRLGVHDDRNGVMGLPVVSSNGVLSVR